MATTVYTSNDDLRIFRKVETLAVATTLTAADSGKIFILDAAAGKVVTLPALKEGCVDLFKDFMVEEGRWRDEAWNESSLTYKFLNGSKMQFKSYDKIGRASCRERVLLAV
jgi:hypothetical protein